MLFEFPYLISITFVDNPSNPMSVFLSLFPFSALQTISIRLALTTIPLWQIASFVNAVLAFGLAAFAKRYFEYNWQVRGRTVYRLVRISGVTRVCLSCYTIGCSLWITVSTVEAFKLPRIGDVLPWS